MKIETPDQFRRARDMLGLSLDKMGKRLRLNGPHWNRTVRNIETDRQPLTGPICVAVEYMLQDWQDITTCPKNGDPFDIWDAKHRVRIPDCYWNDVAKVIVSPYLAWSGKASHWRPCPQAPCAPSIDAAPMRAMEGR